MTIRLRPHHLLCMLTYVGEGYSGAFTANYDAVIGRLRDGETVRIVDGPDTVCGPLLADRGAHCHRAGVTERDRRAARDVGALLDCGIEPGVELRIDAPTLDRLRAAFQAGDVRAACAGCEWAPLCSNVAGVGFGGVKLQVASAGA